MRALTESPQDLAWRTINRYHGMQRVDELAAAIRMVCDLEPSTIVEIGCMNGGTLYAWRQICDEVYGITLPLPNPAYPITHGAQVLRGDSHDAASLAWLRDRLAGRPIDVLHIDGDHTMAGVRADWDMYTPLVRPDGLVLIHDVCNERDPDMDVPRFWQEISPNRKTKVIASRRSPLGFGVVTMEESSNGTG